LLSSQSKLIDVLISAYYIQINLSFTIKIKMGMNFLPLAFCFSADFQEKQGYILLSAALSGFLLTFMCSTYLIFLCFSIPEKTVLTKLTLIQAISDILFAIVFYIELDAATLELCTIFSLSVAFFVNASLFSITLLSLSTFFEKRSEQEKFEAKLNKLILYCLILNLLHTLLAFLFNDINNDLILFIVGFALTGFLVLSIAFLNIRLILRIKYYNLKLENNTPIILTSLILVVWIEGIVEQVMDIGQVSHFYFFVLTAFLQEGVGAVNFIGSYRRIRSIKLMKAKQISISSKTADSLYCQMYQALDA
jgi:hypothetical protein